MRKIFAIAAAVVGAFILEALLHEMVGQWFRPNFFLILVVFFNLLLGIRYSLITAVLSGVLKDSFSIQAFGLYTFSFVLCAFMTTFLKKYLYHPGSKLSRVWLVFLITTLNIFFHYLISLMFVELCFVETVRAVLIPEVLATTLITTYAFGKLRQCVSAFFV